MEDHSLTEGDSGYEALEHMEITELITSINQEDQTVASSVARSLPQIEALLLQVVDKLKKGGRLFYIGAGTSGRLGIVDASECPPTFGVPPGMVIGIIAGGDAAIRQSIEGAEDDTKQGIKDLEQYNINEKDIVIGITASGRTPYVVHALQACNERNIRTGCIVCNEHSAAAAVAAYPIEVLVGPEFVTGSTRMKAGTAQKLVLNMISTATMIQLGRVEGNKMIHMKLSNNKLIARGKRIVMEKTGLNEAQSEALLTKNNFNIAEALVEFRRNENG